ncbi:hypothetical protein MLGJGCBP_03147 [Rhodococcus sp. T7]|nr:hypothetical protein MLGJGCBP_03147 [Rhodococcus sp. T7]
MPALGATNSLVPGRFQVRGRCGAGVAAASASRSPVAAAVPAFASGEGPSGEGASTPVGSVGSLCSSVVVPASPVPVASSSTGFGAVSSAGSESDDASSAAGVWSNEPGPADSETSPSSSAATSRGAMPPSTAPSSSAQEPSTSDAADPVAANSLRHPASRFRVSPDEPLASALFRLVAAMFATVCQRLGSTTTTSGCAASVAMVTASASVAASTDGESASPGVSAEADGAAMTTATTAVEAPSASAGSLLMQVVSIAVVIPRIAGPFGAVAPGTQWR